MACEEGTAHAEEGKVTGVINKTLLTQPFPNWHSRAYIPEHRKSSHRGQFFRNLHSLLRSVSRWSYDDAHSRFSSCAQSEARRNCPGPGETGKRPAYSFPGSPTLVHGRAAGL